MSYGTNGPFGLQPRSYLNGSTFTGQTNHFPIASGYATSLYTGDPVTTLANGTIGIAVAGAATMGVFMGVNYQDANGDYKYSSYWPAGTVTMNGRNANAAIIDDPNVIYSIQVSTSANAPGPGTAIGITQANVWKNANFAVAAAANSFSPVTGPNGVYTPPANPIGGSTRTGQSGYFLDASTIATTATLSLKILRLEPSVNANQVFYQAGPPTVGVFNNALVTINNDTFKGGTGTVGT